jgi:high-affinity K+ transport system ATPase subunit B
MNQSIASNDTYIEWKHILVDSFKKLLPQKMLSNPIMFVVWGWNRTLYRYYYS